MTLRRARWLVPMAVVIASFGIVPTLSTPVAADNANVPFGTQRVLVIPIEFPSCGGCTPSAGDSRYCPDTSVACPAGQIKFTTPRHSPAQWESIFNNGIDPLFSQMSYGQMTTAFTVLNDPATTDGWWPAPHATQLYQESNWATKQPKQLPYAADTAESVIDSICSNPILILALGCGKGPTNFPHNFDRLVILNNWHDFGGQSYGNGALYPIKTNTIGTLNITATVTNEAWDDTTAIETLSHELGHQIGELSHYGDCEWFPPPFISGTPQTTLDCLGEWDLMSYTYCSAVGAFPSSGACSPVTQFGGYSRFAVGWVDPSTTVAHDIVAEGPFTQTVSIAPIEVAPSSTRPNLIRLSEVPLEWKAPLGYDVECRQRVNGDNGIPDSGLIVTNVHEFSTGDLFHPTPAEHVMRSINPTDTIATAMHPGDVFTDNQLGLQVRFDRYVNDDAIAPAQRCQVTIANLKPLPRAGFVGVQFAPELAGMSVPVRGLSPDLSVGKLLAPNAGGTAPTGPVPVDPPWVEHDNPLLLRVHDFTQTAIKSLNARVAVTPGVFSTTCGRSLPGLKSVKIKNLPAFGDATGSADWMAPTATSAVVVDSIVKAKGTHGSNSESGYAFQFHDSSGAPQITDFSISAARSCRGPQTYVVAPAAVPDGWTVDVEPPVVDVLPGQTVPVHVTITAPADTPVGTAAQIPVVLQQQMSMAQAAPPGVGAGCTQFAFCETLHLMPVASLDVVNRVVGEPASIGLSCPFRANPGSDITVNADVTSGGGSTLVEFTAPGGRKHYTRIANFDPASGRWSASFTAKQKGIWNIVSRWGGDDAHAPVESTRCNVGVGVNPGT